MCSVVDNKAAGPGCGAIYRSLSVDAVVMRRQMPCFGSSFACWSWPMENDDDDDADDDVLFRRKTNENRQVSAQSFEPFYRNW